MHVSRILNHVTQYYAAWQGFIGKQDVVNTRNSIAFEFSQEWHVLGPFQIGTREAPWGADPLEYHGGFHNLTYDSEASFKSGLAFNGTVSWSKHNAEGSNDGDVKAAAALSVEFPDIDWNFLQDYYGSPALQWQGWARGEMFVHSNEPQTLILYTDNILEYWIDDTHYFGGDFYGYRRAPSTLHLIPGAHTIHIRLIRDVRSMGAFVNAAVDIKLELQRSSARLRTLLGFDKDILISDVVGGDWGTLASPYCSIIVRNDASSDIYVHGIEGMADVCEVELLSQEPIKLVPGQTRPIPFRIACVPSYNRRLYLELRYQNAGVEHTMSMSKWPRVLNKEDPHKVTFLHSSGIVSYAILKPPMPNVQCEGTKNGPLPVLISLHGAGVDADWDEFKHAFDPLGDLCAWILYPTGVTTWSGDDWHNWGWLDVEAAVAAIPKWIKQVEWDGPDVEIDRWLVVGHSNGGQGAWFALTHRPDKLIGVAALSGFSSVQSYVPFTLWHSADPGRSAVIQGATLSYQHELLLENARDIPVYQQHGSLDDNVPPYQSRFLSLRIQQAGAESTYVEMLDRPHWWDGVMSTEPLGDFIKRQLSASLQKGTRAPTKLHDFSVITATPGEMGTKHGVEILQLVTPGQLGRIDVVVEPLGTVCSLHLTNILEFRLSKLFNDCSVIALDGQVIDVAANSARHLLFRRSHQGWELLRESGTRDVTTSLLERRGRQLGAMNAILRSRDTFSIVKHSNGTDHIALQISRNLCQYFAADTEITEDYKAAMALHGSVISIAVGHDIPESVIQHHPVQIKDNKVHIQDGDRSRVYPSVPGDGLAAIFLRPLPNERLELVVWAADEKSLPIVARLVPMMTGAGQPDFVVANRKMLWKGVEGTLALGFLDSRWNVSTNSFLS